MSKKDLDALQADAVEGIAAKPSTKTTDRKMRTRDLIYAGAFGAIYLVLMLIIVMGSGAIPILYLLTPLTVGLVCGTVYLLCVVKVHKFGAALILGVLFALVACSASIPGLVLGIAAALGAELVLFLGKYRSKTAYLASFVVFNINMSAPFLMLLLAYDRFLEMVVGYRGQAFADTFAALTPDGIWFAILGLALLGGLGGSFIGSRLIKKHFTKAGIV